MIPTCRGVDSSPSETISVVAHAGGWTASVAIIAQLVSMIDSVALAASPSPATDSGGGVAVIAIRPPSSDHASKPASPPMRWLATMRAEPMRSPVAGVFEGEDERSGAETREDERLAAGPRDHTENGKQQPGVQARHGAAAHVTLSKVTT